MEALNKSIGSLLLDPKFSDLEFQCDGRAYPVHRAILCSRSEVFANEYDENSKVSMSRTIDVLELTRSTQTTDGRAIKHTLFDALTFERMLQSIYQGDYTVSAAALRTGTSDEGSNGTTDHGSAPEILPPHLRKALTNGTCMTVHGVQSHKLPATSPMAAHVLVYAIAGHYEIPELRALALREFKEAKTTLTIQNFLELVKTVYGLTQSTEDELRVELLAILRVDHAEWLEDGTFLSCLTNDIELHASTVMLVSVMFQNSTEQKKKQQDQAASQAVPNGVLLPDLEQVTVALKTTDTRVKELEAQLAAAKSALVKSESQVSRLVASQKITEERAKKHLEQANESTKALKEKDETLKSMAEQYLKNNDLCKQNKEALKKERERANKNYALCNEKDQTIKKETDRANKNYELCNQKDQTIKKETDRANNNGALLNQKDLAITAERIRAQQADSKYLNLVDLLVNWDECRHCGAEFYHWFETDGRIENNSGGRMLRCLECRTRHFGRKVE